MQMLVETLLFYHPAVWWVSSRIRHERELCCDDLAVSACAGPICYARALTTLEKLRAAAPAMAVGSTGGSLFFRIQRIVGAAELSEQPSPASGIVALSLAVACLVFSVNWAHGQSPAQTDLLAQGDVLIRAGASDLALQKYREGIQLDPAKRTTYQKRMIETLMRMGNRPEALAVNEQLLREHPDDTDGLGLRAVSLLDQGDSAGAIALLQRVLAQAPDNPVAHLDLGLAYAAQNQNDLARQQMEEAIRLRPDFIRARRALEDLERGGNRMAQPAPPDALTQLGGLGEGAEVKRRYDDALPVLQAEAMKAPLRQTLIALGNTAVHAGRYDLAIETYQKVLGEPDLSSGQQADLRYRLGEAYRRKGDSAGAIQELQKARELDPGNRESLISLILALEAAGRSQEAFQLREQAAAVQRQQAATTTSFLQQEVALAQLKVLEAQRAPNPDPAAIRLAEANLDEAQRRLQAAREIAEPAGKILAKVDGPAIPELPVHLGDKLTPEVLEKVTFAVRSFDPGLEVRVESMGDGKAAIVIHRPRR
jgi:tetratricopeptide (TPR) repeat protein